MERAELAAGSIEVRGSGAVHRLLNVLGAFFLGIGPAAERTREEENWWDRDVPASGAGGPVAMTLGRQAEMFDDAGRVAPSAPAALAPAVPAAAPAPAAPQTIVMVQPRARAAARPIVTTRRVAVPVRVASVAKGAVPARGAVARHLLMSQSISSGKEESRWFSVPQRVLLPRFQLFEGADAVTEGPGGLRIGSPSMRAQRGRVWFV